LAAAIFGDEDGLIHPQNPLNSSNDRATVWACAVPGNAAANINPPSH